MHKIIYISGNISNGGDCIQKDIQKNIDKARKVALHYGKFQIFILFVHI